MHALGSTYNWFNPHTHSNCLTLSSTLHIGIAACNQCKRMQNNSSVAQVNAEAGLHYPKGLGQRPTDSCLKSATCKASLCLQEAHGVDHL